MLGTEVFTQPLVRSFLVTDEEIQQAFAELRSITTITRHRQEQHCDEGDSPVIGWVEAGMVRKYVIYASGQRRIIDLLMPGDFFGLSESDGGLDVSLQAVVNGTFIARCSRRRLFALAAQNWVIGRLLHERAHQAIGRLEAHSLVQSRTRAAEKVGAYLLCLAKRLGASASDLDLPITRYDIADHLGIAVETVCRAITDLRQAGAINFNSPRRISILDTHRFGPDG